VRKRRATERADQPTEDYAFHRPLLPPFLPSSISSLPPLPPYPTFQPPLYPIPPEPPRLHGEVACKRAFNETRAAFNSANQTLAEVVNTTRFTDNRWAERIRGRATFLNKVQGAVVHFISGARGYHTGQQWGLWTPEQLDVLGPAHRRGIEYLQALDIHQKVHCGCWLSGFAPLITHLRGVYILHAEPNDACEREVETPRVTPPQDLPTDLTASSLNTTRSSAVVTEVLPSASDPVNTPGENEDFRTQSHASYPTALP